MNRNLHASLAALMLVVGGCGSSDAADPSSATDDGATPDGATIGDETGGTPPGDGATPPDSAVPPAVPTVSSWLGTNVAADLPRVDVAQQLSPFDTAASSKDENGYPVAGASGKSSTDIGFIFPTGTYKISFKGNGTLQVSGIGALAGAWTTVGDEQRNTLQITGTPGEFGHFLTLQITNAPGQSVHDVHIVFPGFDFDTKEVFLPEFLRLLKPFRALRFMEWENINGSTLTTWAERPKAASFGASPFGMPWEHIVELVNQTGKDCWIAIPEHANDEFVAQLAHFVASQLDFARIEAARTSQGFKSPFRLILENSNETWNNGFSVYGTFLAAAKADPSRYDGKYAGKYGPDWMSGNADLMKVGQYEADRLVKAAEVFRKELSAIGKADVVAPVLSGWAIGAVYSDVALRFIRDHYGEPSKYITYVATAPYFGPEDKDTGALPALFSATNANIDSMDATFQDFAKLVKEYGLQMAAYEGGQGLSGNTNLTIKHLAQHDQRMYDAYNRYFALWKKNFGDSLFMHFDLTGVAGLPEFIYQYGFWGSIVSVMEDPAKCSSSLPTLTGAESVSDVVHHCPKYRALMEQVPR